MVSGWEPHGEEPLGWGAAQRRTPIPSHPIPPHPVHHCQINSATSLCVVTTVGIFTQDATGCQHPARPNHIHKHTTPHTSFPHPPHRHSALSSVVSAPGSPSPRCWKPGPAPLNNAERRKNKVLGKIITIINNDNNMMISRAAHKQSETQGVC